MPCNDSTKETEGTGPTPTLVTEDGQLMPFASLMQPTDIPVLIDYGNGNGILTTYFGVPGDAEAGGHYSQATITITDQVTVTVTMAPSTLVTLQTLGAHIETATSTVTAASVGSLCTTTGTAIGVPIACAFGTSALMFGLFCWYRRRRSLSDKRRLEAAVATLGYSDHSTNEPARPNAIPRPCGSSGRGETDSGIVAPPSSLDSQLAVPPHDLDTRLGPAPAHRLPHDLADYGHYSDFHGSIFVGGYGTMPQTDTSIGNETRLNSRANGSVSRRNSNAAVVTNNHARREFISSALFSENRPTVVYAPPRNESGGAGPVIQAAQTAPLRAIEIAGHGHTSQRASIVELPEEQESDIRASSIVPSNQERGEVAELEGSPVPRRSSATSNGKNVERDSINTLSDDSEARTLGRNSPIELSADHPIHELGTDGAVSPANIEQNDDNEQTGDKADVQKVTQDDSKVDQSAESPAKK